MPTGEQSSRNWIWHPFESIERCSCPADERRSNELARAVLDPKSGQNVVLSSTISELIVAPERKGLMHSPTVRRILIHAVPSFITERPGAGHWKDVRSRRLLWPELDFPVHTVEFDQWSEVLGNEHVPEATDILIEYSWWPELIAQLRERNRTLRIHVRAHNAEMLQHWERSQVVWSDPYRGAKTVYGAARILVRDIRIRLSADTILGISQWDNRHYWSRLPGRGLIRHLPYYCPWTSTDGSQQSMDWNKRSKAVLCLPGLNDPISMSIVEGFTTFAQAASREGSPIHDWRFELSSGLLAEREESAFSRISILAPDGDLWKRMGQVRAVAVLGRLGYGTKTTIVDAIAAGCHVLVHPTLLERLPSNVREACVRCDPESLNDVSRAAHALMAPPVDAAHINRQIREEALGTLKEILFDRNWEGAVNPSGS